MGALLRDLHDATAGFALPDGVAWAPEWSPEGPGAVICHGDFSPTNLLFRGGLPVGVIDFDLAAPGPRSWDLASAVYRTAPLHAPELFARWGLAAPSLELQLTRLRAVLGAYGGVIIGDVLDALEVQLERHIRLIRTEGDRFAVQRAEFHDEAYATDLAWLCAQRRTLQAGGDSR